MEPNRNLSCSVCEKKIGPSYSQVSVLISYNGHVVSRIITFCENCSATLEGVQTIISITTEMKNELQRLFFI
jgi:hypothetical protein